MPDFRIAVGCVVFVLCSSSCDGFCLISRPTESLKLRAAEDGARAMRGSGKVPVELASYDDMRLTVSKTEFDDAAVEAKFQAVNKPYVLTPVRVAEEGGAREGRVVIADVTLRGEKLNGHMIELVLDQKAPWDEISREILGMGQMEFKSFQLKDEGRCDVLVKQVYAKTPDQRTDQEKRVLVKKKMDDMANRANEEALDKAIREDLSKRCFVDTDNVVNSVSWAKFGPKSLADYQWALIQEEIADKEKIDFLDVAAFLRDRATVTWSSSQ